MTKVIKREIIDPLANIANGVCFGNKNNNINYGGLINLNGTKEYSVELLCNFDGSHSNSPNAVLGNNYYNRPNGVHSFVIFLSPIGNKFFINVNYYIKGETTGLSKSLFSVEIPDPKKLYHIILTRDNTEFKMYLDGKFVGSAQHTEISNIDCTFLNSYIANSSDFKLFRVYNMCLNQDNVNSLFNFGNSLESNFPEDIGYSTKYTTYSSIGNNGGSVCTETILDDRIEILVNSTPTNGNTQYPRLAFNRDICNNKRKFRFLIDCDCKDNESFTFSIFEGVKFSENTSQAGTTKTFTGRSKLSWDHKDFVLTYNGHVYLDFGTATNVGKTLIIYNLLYEKLGCIAEYKPSGLHKKIWYDSSGNGNHLTGNNITKLLYKDNNIKPLKTLESIPDFIGETIIVDNNNYVSTGLTNEDWRKI